MLAFRSGMANMARNAVFGGAILAAIEGFSIALTRHILPAVEQYTLKSQMPEDPLDPPVDPLHDYFKKMNSGTSFPLIRDTQYAPINSALSVPPPEQTVETPAKSSWSLW